MKIISFIVIFISLLNIGIINSQEKKLNGITISSDDINEITNYAFDGDLSTNFISSLDYGWIGKELQYPSKITKIGFHFEVPDVNMYLLGMFQGANEKDFFDAIPLYMIKEEIKISGVQYIKINCKQTFRYIRYVGPIYSGSIISEFEIYGIEYPDNNQIIQSPNLYQPTNIPLLIISPNNIH